MADFIGKTIGGCEILSLIGKGGMGVVYRARQISLDRIVALKVLSPHYADNPTFTARFMREARAIARITHPNILGVYDVGNQDEIHYMLMELVEGTNLSHVLEQRGKLPQDEATDIVRQCALGLECAARAGIVHRDVKPDNILMTTDFQVKLSDFGLAKEMNTSVTATDAVMGTPAFMSPEQCDGLRLDHRSDIYSLGASFFRMVTGQLPFNAETAMSMMYRHKHEPLTPPRKLEPSVSEAYNSIIVRMMAKEPEDRFQSFTTLIAALETAAAHPDEIPPLARASAQLQTVIEQPLHRTQSGRLIEQPPEAPWAPDALPRGPVPPEEEEHVDETPESSVDSVGWRPFTDQERTASRILPRHRQEETEEQIRTHLREAELLGTEARYNEALREIRKALKLRPEHPKARSLLKDLDERVKAKRQAIGDIRRLIQQQEVSEAVRLWDELPDDLREESMRDQIERFRNVTLPAAEMLAEAQEMVAEGRLEAAIRRFGDVLELDSENEAARQGEKDARLRLERASQLLQEAYDQYLQRSFGAAIDTLQKVLSIVPNHPPAVSRLIEALLSYGHEIRAREDGPQRAQEQWRRILELDPDHTEAAKLLRTDQERNAQLQSLLDQGSRHMRERRYGKARRCWRRALRIDGANSRAQQGLSMANRRRRRFVAAAYVLTVFVSAVAAGATFAWQEYRLVQDVRQQLDQGRHEQALSNIAGLRKLRPVLFLRGRIEDLETRATLQRMTSEAEAARTEGRLTKALEILERAQAFSRENGLASPERQIKQVRLEMLVQEIDEIERGAGWGELATAVPLTSRIIDRVVSARKLADGLPNQDARRKQLRQQSDFYLKLRRVLDARQRNSHPQRTLYRWYEEAVETYEPPQNKQIIRVMQPPLPGE